MKYVIYQWAILWSVVGAFSAGEIAAAKSFAWDNKELSADRRAQLVLESMTLQEKLTLVFGYFSTDLNDKNWKTPKEGLPYSAGYIPGIPRLGIPPQWQTDAGLGVATQISPHPRGRTALPSGPATAATWNPEVAYAGGAMIGNEARLSGFNVHLAGGMNLLREPRNGRNFEYAGEDPVLTGVIVGQEIKGIQSNHIMSTIKHYAFNNQETNRFTIDPQISQSAARMSDLLAFEIALSIANPASVMCSYNRVNSFYACESDWLLNQVLKKDWGYKGFVMSDWGATHSTIPAANSGLDQESGYPFDLSPYFSDALKEAVTDNYVSTARFDDMAVRILRQMFEKGLFDDPVHGDQASKIDFAAHAKITQTDAEEGIVLLKNAHNLLPLSKDLKKIAIIGGHADAGVLSGGGSSQVYPVGGLAIPNEGLKWFPGPIAYYPSSPLKGLAKRLAAKVKFNDGKNVTSAAKLAADSDVALVFATQWTAESVDVPDLHLPQAQDALIAAVARANKNTIVVLENGGPLVMPWLNDVSAIVEAWYPGTEGGEAIARILTGEVNPSGHLPMTFPVSESQLPRPKIDGDPAKDGVHFLTNYNIEGAAVGYKWFDLKGLTPLFPFGHGLSYTKFSYSNVKIEKKNDDIRMTFKVTNSGKVAGKTVAQVYVASKVKGWESPKRLNAWAKLSLNPGETLQGSIHVDPHLLAVYDGSTKKWKIRAGEYQVILAESASAPVGTGKIHLASRQLGTQLMK
jgi:beta-glucosidase